MTPERLMMIGDNVEPLRGKSDLGYLEYFLIELYDELQREKEAHEKALDYIDELEGERDRYRVALNKIWLRDGLGRGPFGRVADEILREYDEKEKVTK